MKPKLSGWLRRVLGAWFALKAANLLTNALLFPKLRDFPADALVTSDISSISILIPARNESHNLPQLLPQLLEQVSSLPANLQAELLVLDDHSQDDTAQVARQLGARVLTGQPLPKDWLGKSWACQQLAEAATGDLLIFIDADVRFHNNSLLALLQQYCQPHNTQSRPSLLTILPRPEDLSFGARLLTPLVDVVVLSLLPYPLLQTRWPLATTANGQVMLFERGAYWQLGGHACVRGEILEDTVFARKLKAVGQRVTQALGGQYIGVRMYRSYRESLAGFGKNSLAVHFGSRPLLCLSWLWHLLVYSLPWLLPPSKSIWLWRLAGLLERPIVAWLTERRRQADLTEGLLSPLTPLAALPAYWRSARRRVIWKGRSYKQT